MNELPALQPTKTQEGCQEDIFEHQYVISQPSTKESKQLIFGISGLLKAIILSSNVSQLTNSLGRCPAHIAQAHIISDSSRDWWGGP